MFRKTRLVAATALAALTTFSAPALAGLSADQQIKAKVIERNGVTLYCIKDVATGTRVPRRICMTSQEWNDAGGRIAHKEAPAVEEGAEMASSARKGMEARN